MNSAFGQAFQYQKPPLYLHEKTVVRNARLCPFCHCLLLLWHIGTALTRHFPPPLAPKAHSVVFATHGKPFLYMQSQKNNAKQMMGYWLKLFYSEDDLLLPLQQQGNGT